MKTKNDIQVDRAHDIEAGQRAIVSISPGHRATMTVISIGKHGATMRDDQGRQYGLRWSDIVGPAPRPEEKPVALAKALPPEPKRPSMEPGDSIYYHHPDTGAPHYGAVAAVGKHGMLVDADGGGEHKVHWDKYIAHKARVQRKLTVVDKGEDGSICTDETGRRVFIQGEIPSDDDEEGLTKALSGDYEAASDQLTLAVNDALAPVLRALDLMQRQHQDSLAQFTRLIETAIGRPLPAINLQMPKSEPANVQVDVHVPEQPKPVINVAAPVVNVAAPAAPVVNVTVPKNTVTRVERDKDGNITRAIQEEA